MTGAAEPFRTQRMRSSGPYEEEEVIAFHGNSLNSAIPLTPFCTWAKCPEGRPPTRRGRAMTDKAYSSAANRAYLPPMHPRRYAMNAPASKTKKPLTRRAAALAARCLR